MKSNVRKLDSRRKSVCLTSVKLFGFAFTEVMAKLGRHVTREIRVSSQVLSHINRRTTQRRKLRDNFIRVEKRSPGQASFLKEGDRDKEEETEFQSQGKEGLEWLYGASEKRRETPKYQKYHAKPK